MINNTIASLRLTATGRINNAKPSARNINFILLVLAALVAAPLALPAAELKLAGVFTDHLVLQRNCPVPVWGWGNAGEQVSVEFAGQRKVATADGAGKWIVKLDPLPASAQSRVLTVTSATGNREVRIADVLVGDVWLCSGQSNMYFRMNRVENSSAEIAAASHPELRFFSAAEQFAQEPATNVAGQWRPLSPATAADCSAVAYYFGRDSQRKLRVPVGLLISSVGGTRIETWMQSGTISNCAEAQSLLDAWKNVSPTEFRRINQTYVEYQRQRDVVFPALVKQAQAEGKAAPHLPRPPSKKCHTCPSALHNGMIAPLQPFAIRGALWYQGESNVSNPAAYEKFSRLMIADWRRVWGDELPFLFVQLPPYKGSSPDFREAQFHIWQHTPRTAMVVTTDVGNADNVHPTRKMPVGERLALAARAIAYGEPIEYCGPVFASMTVTSNRAVISFTHLGGGLVAQGGSLKGFSIAGKDGRFVEADAVIEGSTVVVTSEKVSRPVAVRYGWSKVPDVNLFNQEGLPAVPFRTDAK